MRKDGTTMRTIGTRGCVLAVLACRIVFAQVVDPVGAGLVASLARPGGNATGFTSLDYAFAGKMGRGRVPRQTERHALADL